MSEPRLERAELEGERLRGLLCKELSEVVDKRMADGMPPSEVAVALVTVLVDMVASRPNPEMAGGSMQAHFERMLTLAIQVRKDEPDFSIIKHTIEIGEKAARELQH